MVELHHAIIKSLRRGRPGRKAGCALDQRHSTPSFFCAQGEWRIVAMRHCDLTWLANQLNRLIDSAKYQNVKQSDVHTHIDTGDLLVWMKQCLADDISLSAFMPESDLGVPPDLPKKNGMEWIKNQARMSRTCHKDGEKLINALQRTANVVCGEWNSGLGYLLSLVIEIIQNPNEWEQ